MPISVNPIFPVISAQGAASDVVLQPGTVVDAQVLKVLANDLVRIAIANLSIDALSEIPLQAGQTLQLAVSQTPEGIKLAVVGQGTGAPGHASLPVSAGSGPVSASIVSAAVTLTPGTAIPNAPVIVANAAAPTAPPKIVLTPLESLAVSAVAQTAATRQQSLAPLFANLGVVVGSEPLPPKLQQAVAQVLALRPGLDQNLTGEAVKSAFQQSGIFLEASLAQEAASPAQGVPAPSPAAPDLKAALIVLRQTLVSLGEAVTPEHPSAPAAANAATAKPPPQSAYTAPAPEPWAAEAALKPQTASPSLAPSLSPEIDVQEVFLPQARLPVADDFTDGNGTGRTFSAAASPLETGPRAVTTGAALNLLQEALQSAPKGVGNPVKFDAADNILLDPFASTAGQPKALRIDDSAIAHTNTPPPPFRGALPSPQPVASPSFAPDTPLAATVHHLLDDTDAAIARQTLLQVASLPDRADGIAARTDPTSPKWAFEIPFATPLGTAMAQFEIARDGGGNEVEAAKRVWRARFSLDVEPAGPVHALVSLIGDKTSVRMWAERPATAEQLRAGASQLSQALSKAELRPGDIVIQNGAPVQSASAPAGHFLDRAL